MLGVGPSNIRRRSVPRLPTPSSSAHPSGYLDGLSRLVLAANSNIGDSVSTMGMEDLLWPDEFEPPPGMAEDMWLPDDASPNLAPGDVPAFPWDVFGEYDHLDPTTHPSMNAVPTDPWEVDAPVQAPWGAYPGEDSLPHADPLVTRPVGEQDFEAPSMNMDTYYDELVVGGGALAALAQAIARSGGGMMGGRMRAL